MPLNGLKTTILAVIGCIGGVISSLYGGWSVELTTLVTLQAIDYVTGLMVGGIFKTSPKTDTGALNSKVGFKGLCKKFVTLLIVFVAHRIDILLGTNFIMPTTIIGYASNEMLSIIENCGLMGVPIPAAITKAIDLLNKKEDKNG